MAGRAVLELEAVRHRYGTGGAEVLALDGVDLAVGPGEVVAVFGPSGSGKTTLLHLAAGLEHPSEGRVLFEATDLAGLSEAERSALRRRRLGVVFQFFNLVPALTAVENVALTLRFDGVAAGDASERAREALARVGVEHRRGHLPGELSGGEMQRVAVARAIVAQPALLLADEPTGSLDSRNGDLVLELIASLARERDIAVLLASHDGRAAKHADRVLTMRDGSLAAPAPAGEPARDVALA
ncbi:MAG TPA: ABC transporter ATP-binding protein [Thermoleophilaceae bacterium]|jgi:putative ABC transport system ATP-binding protein